MKAKTLLLSTLLSLGLLAGAHSAHAGPDACKNTTFKVTSGFNKEIKVTGFQLFSRSEGRWLKVNIPAEVVPANARGHVVARGQDIRNAENDLITKIKVALRYRELDGDWSDLISREDGSVRDEPCYARRQFIATVSP